MPQKSWETTVSAIAVEAARGLRGLADPRPDDDRVKTAIGRAARKAGLRYWRAFDLWYGKARRIDAWELEAIRAAARAKKTEARNEFLTLAADFNALAERIARVDPEMAGDQADGWREMARQVRALADGT